MRKGAALLSLAVAAALTLAGSSSAKGGLPACTTAQLVPQLSDFSVNQGLPTYTTAPWQLTRAKNTLVKLYLTLPSTCGGTIAISSTSTLTVDNGSQTFSLTPYGSSANGSLSATAQTNSNADPLFVVPAADLQPGDGSAGFTATFTANVKYKQNSSSTVVGQTFTRTVSFDRKTNALRVLVVPMGDAGLSFSSQFPALAQTDVQNAMATLSRIYPVEDGIGDLASATGGIRYTIDLATLLNLRAISGAYDTNNKFCGTQANFDAIKSQLAQYRQSWNTANPMQTADIVVGVAHQSISDGGSAGCAEGMASITSPEAWVRAVDDQPTTRPATISTTGALMAMEIFHTFGGKFGTASHHSSNIAADGTAPGKAYNLAARTQLSSSHSAMLLNDTGSPWDNSDTVLEPQDYADLHCFLTGSGQTTTNCATAGTVGSATGVAAGPQLVGSGVTDGTPGGTSVVETYYSEDVAPGGTCPTSNIKLVQSFGSTQQTDGVCVAAESSVHDDGPDDVVTGGVFSFSVDALTGATGIQLVNQSTGQVLYSATKQTTPPQVTSVSFQKSFPSFTLTAPTVPPTPDIVFLADTTGSMDAALANVKTGVAGIAGQIKDARPNAEFGAASYKDFDCDATPFSVDRPLTADTSLLQTGVNSWSAGGGCDTPESQLNALYQLATSGGVGFRTNSSRIVAWFGDQPGHDPSNGHSLPDAITALEAANIRVVAVSVGANQLDATGQATAITKATGGVLLTGVNVDNVSQAILNGLQNLPVTLAHTESCNQAGLTLTLGAQQEENPVPGGSTVHFGTSTVQVDGSVPPGSYQCTASFTVDGTPDGTLTQTFNVDVPQDQPPDATVVATTSVPQQARLDLLYSCNGTNYVVAAGLPPTQTTSTTASWATHVDLSVACGGQGTSPQLLACVSDGFSRSCSGSPSPVPATTAKQPTAAIYVPTQLTVVTGATMPLYGTGYDAEGRELPNSALQWSLDGTGKTAGGSSGAIGLNGVAPGTYTLSLTANDGSLSASDTRTIDVVAPPAVSVTHTGGATSTAGSVTENVSASAGAGLATVACTVDGDPASIPAVTNPAPGAPYSATIAVSGLGLHTVKCTATDAAGNSADAVDQVQLAYTFIGFLPPVDNVVTNTGKAGRTYPVKWQLKNAAGALITSTAVVRGITFASIPCTTLSPTADALETTATGGTSLRNDSGQFVYDWQTPSKAGCYVLTVSLDDDSVHQALFKLT